MSTGTLLESFEPKVTTSVLLVRAFAGGIGGTVATGTPVEPVLSPKVATSVLLVDAFAAGIGGTVVTGTPVEPFLTPNVTSVAAFGVGIEGNVSLSSATTVEPDLVPKSWPPERKISSPSHSAPSSISSDDTCAGLAKHDC